MKRLVEEAVVAVIAVVDAYGKVLAPVAVEVMAPEIASVEVAVIAPPKNEVPEMYELPWTERVRDGVVVPTPMLPATYALPVVVAPPEIVSPVACPPAPIVEEAKAVSPPLNCVRVVVALPATLNG